MMIIGDNLKARIETDNENLLKALYELYSFTVPGSSYTPQFKAHRWDGKTHFISRSGEFKAGLLPRLLNDLLKIGCSPVVVPSLEIPKKEILDYKIPGFEYYDFQETFIKEILKKQRGIISSPTGSGKTLILAGIVKALSNRRIVILFDEKHLLQQTYEFLSNECFLKGIGLCFGEGYIPGNIMLCTVQSIEKIIDEFYSTAEVLIVDECHKFCTGKVSLAAIQSFPNASFRIGLTATVPTEEIKLYALEGALGQEIKVKTTQELIQDNILTKPIIQLIKREYLANGEDKNLTYAEVYDKYITNNLERNTKIVKIVEEILKTNEQPRILILTKSLDHGRTLENLLGDKSQFLEGADNLGERYKAISKFRGAKGASILIGTKILQTGINIKEITHFINARGLKSEIATIQALGRTLRRSDNKTAVFVFDFMDQEKFLKTHSNKRKKHYTEQGHEVKVIK